MKHAAWIVGDRAGTGDAGAACWRCCVRHEMAQARIGQEPAAHDSRALEVVINEVAWGGTAASANHEWIELKNNTTTTIDLTGWRLYGSGGTTPPNITLSGTIPVSGYFLTRTRLPI